MQKTVKNLRASCAKDKTAEKAAKEKSKAIASIYVATSYNPWKVETLEFMQTLWDSASQSLPPKKELLQKISSDFLGDNSERKKKKKNIMQFASFMHEEAEAGLGEDALATVLPFDQLEVLNESKEYLSKHLKLGAELDVTIYDLNSGIEIPGDEKKKSLAEPGKPSIFVSAPK